MKGTDDFGTLANMKGKEFLSFFYDDKGKAKDAITTLAAIQTKYKSLSTDVAKNQFLMNITGNSIARVGALSKLFAQ